MSEFLKNLLSCLGSVGLFEFVQFLIKRHDDTKGAFAQLRQSVEKVENQGIKNERDNCRTQLLLLISDFPEEKQEALTLAKHYFVDLKGDWYATSIFQKYLSNNGIPIPPWFNTNHIAG